MQGRRFVCTEQARDIGDSDGAGLQRMERRIRMEKYDLLIIGAGQGDMWRRLRQQNEE